MLNLIGHFHTMAAEATKCLNFPLEAFLFCQTFSLQASLPYNYAVIEFNLVHKCGPSCN